jgi:uncharacterized tellurite resistance protein B-like protein
MSQGFMNITDFTQRQRQALLDLLVLAMYADGHLAFGEDAKLRQLLTAMGFETNYDRSRQLDATVTRVRQHAQTAEATRAYTDQLSQSFTTREHRQQVCDLLDDLLASDNQVAPHEGRFLAVVKEVFRM